MRRRAALLVSAATLASFLLGTGVAPAAAQTVLYSADFDTGLPPGWLKVQLGSTGDNWTVGFGLVNGSGDVNHEWWCNFGGQLRNNILYAPGVNLLTVNDAVLSFDQYHEAIGPLLGPQEFNRVVVSTDNGSSFTQIWEAPESPDPKGFSSVALSLAAFAGFPNVRVGFHYGGVVGNDWSIDNVRIARPWSDLGLGLAGGAGTPLLGGSGALIEGTPIGISLTGAAPSASAYLVVGFTELNLPFYGGTLVPAFEPPLGVFFALSTNGSGALPLASSWPAGVPSGVQMTLQCWVVDAGAPFGLAASNAVRGSVP